MGSGWGILFLPFLVVLELAGVLIANGDGISENFGVDGEGRTRQPTRLHDESRFGGKVPVDHHINVCSRSIFGIRVPHQTCDGWPFLLGHR